MKNFKTGTILKSKQGASLILVLCVMVLLMGISGSVLFAASTAAGGGVERQSYDKLVALSDSIMRTVTYSICRQEHEDFASPEFYEDYIGANLLLDLGNYYNTNINKGDLDQFYPDKDLSISGIDIPDNYTIQSIVMSFPKEDQKVQITKFEPEETIKIDEDNYYTIPRKPQKAQISFDMTVTLKIKDKGEGTQLTTVAKYEFRGGSMEDEGDENILRKVINYGEWKMISNERAEN